MITITTPLSKTISTTGAVCTLAEAKKQCQVETSDTDDDTYITSLIGVATENVKDDINAAILETTNVLEYRIGDEHGETIQTTYRIPDSPLISLTKIEVYDGSTWADIDAATYETRNYFSCFEVEFTTQPASAKRLRFTYKTGHTDATRPVTIKQAVLIRIADLYTTERQSHSYNNLSETKAYTRLLSKHVRHYW